MALEIVARTEKATISRDPSWQTGKHVANITIHDQWVKRAGFYVPVDENRKLYGVDGFALRSGDVRHLVLTANDGSRRWYPRADVLTEFASIGKPEYKVGLAFQTFPIGTPTSTVGTVSVWTRPNFDLSLSENWHKLKLDIALKTELARAARQFQWPFTLTGLTYKDGQLISQKDGKVVGYLSAPTAHDSSPSLMGQGKAIRITQRYVGGYIQYQLNDADMDAAVLPVTIDPTFVDGYGGDVTTYKDLKIALGDPDANYGTATNSGIGRFASDGNIQRVLMEFDVSSLTAGSITSGRLYWRVDNETYSYAGTLIDLYEIAAANSDWVEGTNNGGWQNGSSCWNYKKYSTDVWAGSAGLNTATTDYVNTVIGTFTVPNPPTVGTEFYADITASVIEGWITTNPGILCRARTESGSDQGAHIGLSDHATTSQRPRLEVVYTAAGGGNPPFRSYLSVLPHYRM